MRSRLLPPAPSLERAVALTHTLLRASGGAPHLVGAAAREAGLDAATFGAVGRRAKTLVDAAVRPVPSPTDAAGAAAAAAAAAVAATARFCTRRASLASATCRAAVASWPSSSPRRAASIVSTAPAAMFMSGFSSAPYCAHRAIWRRCTSTHARGAYLQQLYGAGVRGQLRPRGTERPV